MTGWFIFETLTQLETLGLPESSITDAGLDRLQIPPKLKSLSVEGAEVTGAGLQRFRNNHPACSIRY